MPFPQCVLHLRGQSQWQGIRYSSSLLYLSFITYMFKNVPCLAFQFHIVNTILKIVIISFGICFAPRVYIFQYSLLFIVTHIGRLECVLPFSAQLTKPKCIFGLQLWSNGEATRWIVYYNHSATHSIQNKLSSKSHCSMCHIRQL